jgi:hypothetical protein
MKLRITLESSHVTSMKNKNVFLKLQRRYLGKVTLILVYGPCIMFITNKRCSEAHLYIWMLLDRYINVSLEIYGLAQVFCLGY